MLIRFLLCYTIYSQEYSESHPTPIQTIVYLIFHTDSVQLAKFVFVLKTILVKVFLRQGDLCRSYSNIQLLYKKDKKLFFETITWYTHYQLGFWE